MSSLQLGTLEKAYRILALYNEHSESFSFSEIVEKTGLEKSSVQRLLYSLQTIGLLRKHDRYKRYSLSPRFISFAVSFCMSDPLILQASTALEPLARQSREAVSIGHMDGVHVFYVTRVVKGGDTPGALASRDVVLLPVRQYAYCTAAGRAMMSRMGGAEVDRILALSPLRKFTNATLTDPDEIRRLLDVYREEGLAWQDGEVLEDELGLAAPVLGEGGAPVAAVVMSIQKRSFDLASAKRRFGTLIQAAARAMSSPSLSTGRPPA
jgi:IclR family transcriptional regulator, pca regulon regulatory protein